MIIYRHLGQQEPYVQHNVGNGNVIFFVKMIFNYICLFTFRGWWSGGWEIIIVYHPWTWLERRHHDVITRTVEIKNLLTFPFFTVVFTKKKCCFCPIILPVFPIHEWWLCKWILKMNSRTILQRFPRSFMKPNNCKSTY